MPLWFTVPLALLLGILSWISTLDPTGMLGDSYLLWGATAVAASLVLARLLRVA